MLEKLSSKELFNNTGIGIQRVYQLLYAKNGSEIAKSDLTGTTAVNANVNLSDLSFVQLLSQDFTKIDTNKNGTISATELNQLTQNIQSKGLTQEQLYSIYSQTGAVGLGTNKTLLETVLNNFTEVDKNGDGKVSEAEISLYQVNKSLAEEEKEFGGVRSSDFSLFYSDDTDSTSETTSLLDYKYQDSTTENS